MLHLQIRSGRHKGEILSLDDPQLPLTIGRDPKNKLRLEDPAISRFHAVIVVEAGSYYLEDLDSTNGTFLNGRRIRREKLNPGDEFAVANVNISVEAKAAASVKVNGALPLPVTVEEPPSPETTMALSTGQEESRASDFLRETSKYDLVRSHAALQSLYRADQVLRDIDDLKQLLENFMDLIMDVIPASRGYLFLMGKEADAPLLYVRRAPSTLAEDTEVVVSKTILRRAILKRESILSKDALVDERFTSSRSIAQLKVRSAMCAPMINRSKVLGIIYVDSTDKSSLFSSDDLALLSAMALKAAIAVDNARLYEDLRDLFYSTVETLIRTIQAKDRYTSGHSTRVSRYCLLIAEKLGLSTKEKHQLYLAAVLHDIGKIGLPDDLLHHPGKLSEEEMDRVREHPALGASMIRSLGEMHPIVPLILHHHEAYDGTGYPDGLKGEQIPLICRIVAVADSYDAITSDRPYREGRTQDQAVQELKRSAGSKLDPRVVAAFLKVLEELAPARKAQPAELIRPS